MKNKKLYIIIFLSIVFLINTVCVCLNLTSFIDTFVHNYAFTLHNDLNEVLMKTFTFLGSTLWMITCCLAMVIIFIINKKKYPAIVLPINLIVSTILNNVIKVIIRRPRADYMLVVENTFSYPSGHSMASMVFYGTLIYLLSKSKFSKSTKVILTSILVLLILAVGLSRIYFGAHYFSDVFGAYIIGLDLVYILAYINDKKNLI